MNGDNISGQQETGNRLIDFVHSTTENYYAACCVEYMPGMACHFSWVISKMECELLTRFRLGCPSDDGAVGYNCTGYEVDT